MTVVSEEAEKIGVKHLENLSVAIGAQWESLFQRVWVQG
jgi:hypothetical protein